MNPISHPHTTPIKNVTVDAADPNRLAEFWAFALGYVLQPPPPGFETWEAFADVMNLSTDDRERYAAVIDPNGVGSRILFQKVPEGKAVKNRWHLDIDVVDRSLPTEEQNRDREAKIAALVERGATEIARFDEPVGRWVLMTDPEGNEFCVLGP
ncbi:MAG: VOC family protein [Acidimicrobiia bacterium]|nr:VOC family protein [Acidimicrobiia bacterium]MYF83635.1 VOC family protein [Acidimicrobiia bacterium]